MYWFKFVACFAVEVCSKNGIASKLRIYSLTDFVNKAFVYMVINFQNMVSYMRSQIRPGVLHSPCIACSTTGPGFIPVQVWAWHTWTFCVTFCTIYIMVCKYHCKYLCTCTCISYHNELTLQFCSSNPIWRDFIKLLSKMTMTYM